MRRNYGGYWAQCKSGDKYKYAVQCSQGEFFHHSNSKLDYLSVKIRDFPNLQKVLFYLKITGLMTQHVPLQSDDVKLCCDIDFNKTDE